MAPPTYESDSSVFSDEPIAPHRLVELLHNQTEEFNEKVEDIKEVFVKGIEISGECMKSLNESITNKMDEGFENLSDVLDVRTERIALNTNNLFNAICGISEEPSLEAKLKRKIDEQAEEIQKLRKKLSKMNEKMDKVLTLLRISEKLD